MRAVPSVGEVSEVYGRILAAAVASLVAKQLMGIQLKTPDQIAKLREANLVVSDVLDALEAAAAPGLSDLGAERHRRQAAEAAEGGVSAFLGYRGYPAVLCTSVNEVVVHGIPRKDVVLKDGDILSIDFGAFKDGWCGDSARTIPVGKSVAPTAHGADRVDPGSLDAAIAQCVPGNRLGDIGCAVQSLVEKHGLFGGDASSWATGSAGRCTRTRRSRTTASRARGGGLRRGWSSPSSPWSTPGRPDVVLEDDGWTAVTKDGSLSAHFEHSVAITENGPFVLSDETVLERRAPPSRESVRP